MKRRLALVTAGHLSTCPRILKAADALADEGYEVTLVSTRSTPWAAEADLALQERRRGRFRSLVVDYSRNRPLLHGRSGIRRRIARARAARTRDVSFRLATQAFARVHEELVAAALATSADFFYGGTTGGVGAAFEAAKRAGRPYALDLEDFFSGEPEEGSLDERLAERIEREILSGATFLTASSEPIAAAYSTKFGFATEVVHNVFPLPGTPPDLELRSAGPLRLYWFSQTIGPGRGLEEAIAAVGASGIEAELHLRGAIKESYRGTLRKLAGEKAPGLAMALYPPGTPDEMTSLAGCHDIGLSLEQGGSLNNRLALGNKVLTYLLAGLALAMTDTPGQRTLREALGDKALVVPPGDTKALAEGFRRLADDRRHLLDCRRASFRAGAARWHWEHPEERGKLLRLFEAATR